MGAGLSEPKVIPDQIFRSVKANKRRTWLKSTDILDVRLSTSHVEETFAVKYFELYFQQCSLRRDVSEYHPNEEFQQTVDSLEENPIAKAGDLEAVSHKYFHDIIDVVSDIVDDLAFELYKPVSCIPGVGRGYVRKGFFFFVWDSYVGEKFGRLELRNCRKLMELQVMSVHVPLTYCVMYKGRGVTIQALVPVNHTTRLKEPNSTELACIVREIAAALCLSAYDEDRSSFHLSNAVQAHVGKDGRLYFLNNAYWSPPWLSARGDRLSPEQHFSCLRHELLIRKGSPVSCRSFQKEALASENAGAFQVMRKLLDTTLHEVPKVLGTIADTGPDSVLTRFRKLGFNYSMLGLLLLSLFRNVSPPVQAVRAVLKEMFIRGIKQFIMWRTQPPILRGLNVAKDADSSKGAAYRADDDDTHDAELVHTMEIKSSQSFIDFVVIVLRAFLEYQGAPQPRAATLISSAVLPPTDLFGGEVIPHIYKKFRLLPTDVDLYGKMDDEQKFGVYQEVCRSLGVTIEGNQVTRVVPVMMQPSVPSPNLPSWIHRRTDFLIQKLLHKQASRSEWLKMGPALIPLLRLQSQNLPFYSHLEGVFVTLQQPDELTCHIEQSCFNLAALERVIRFREDFSDSMLEKHILIQLYRKRAFAYYDEGRVTDAAEQMRTALAVAETLLEKFGNHFSVQYRRLTSEYSFYVGSLDLNIEINMMRLISRYCEPDVYLADDFLQLAVTRTKLRAAQAFTAVDEMETEWDLGRAVRLYAEALGDRHPKTIRAMANLAIVWLDNGREEDALGVLRSLVADHGASCPLDVKELCLRFDDRKTGWDNVLIIPDAQEELVNQPLMFTFHRPRFSI